jgi:hypothetical protein
MFEQARKPPPQATQHEKPMWCRLSSLPLFRQGREDNPMKRVVVNPGTCLMVRRLPYLPGSILELESDAEAGRLQRLGKITILPDELQAPENSGPVILDIHNPQENLADVTTNPENPGLIELAIQDIEAKSADVIESPAAKPPSQKAPSKSTKAAR